MNDATLLSSMIGPVAMGVALIAAAIDAQHRRIPNWLTFGAWLAALPLQVAVHGFGNGALEWTCGWLTGLACALAREPVTLLGRMVFPPFVQATDTSSRKAMMAFPD